MPLTTNNKVQPHDSNQDLRHDGECGADEGDAATTANNNNGGDRDEYDGGSSTTSGNSAFKMVAIPPSVFAREYEQEVCDDDASMREARRISGGKRGAQHNCSVSVPFSVVLIIAAVVLVVTPCSIVWATSYQKADTSINAISENLVESLSKNVHDIVDGIVTEVDNSLAAEVEWLRFRDINMNVYSQWVNVLRPRYVHFAITSSIGSIYLRSPNLTMICTRHNNSQTGANCARKTNSTDGLNFFLVDAATNTEGIRLSPVSKTTYSSYGKVTSDGVYPDMLSGTPNWGKVVTAQNPIVTISSYHPYMSPSGKLLGVVQGAKTVTGLSENLREIAAGKNVIYVTTQDGYLLGTSNGSVVTINPTTLADAPLLANSSDNAVVAAIAQAIDAQGGCANMTEMKQIHLKVNESTYTIAIAHIPVGQRVWCGFAAIPSSEMMKTIEDGNRVSIIVFVCSIAASVVMAVVLAVLLVIPLRHLAKDMQNLSKLRFKPLGRTVSVFTELHSMLRDYMAMKQGIHAFSRYVSAGVVRQLLDGDDKMSSLYLERHSVTVVFMDVVGFTSLCEKLAPSTLVTLLSLFMQRMCQVLISEGATVDKFIGDCIMSFWNHPHPCDDHAYRAINAVLHCFEELDKLNKENSIKGLPELQFRAGINTGRVLAGNFGSPERVLAGNFGSPERFDYTILGDTVNVAARLEQLNRELGTRLLISESVYNVVAGRVKAQPKGEISIRGREAKVEVYEITPPSAPSSF
ncbi:adenylate/guanilate cyclase [Pelomyxa schiedti]|nr:adenylate/guanilate cyclase [Pelomyxa schiedti]